MGAAPLLAGRAACAWARLRRPAERSLVGEETLRAGLDDATAPGSSSSSSSSSPSSSSSSSLARAVACFGSFSDPSTISFLSSASESSRLLMPRTLGGMWRDHNVFNQRHDLYDVFCHAPLLLSVARAPT